MANEENLKPFKKGYDERRWMQGRAKKLTTLMKEEGYKLSEINDTIQVMISMSEEQLKAIIKDPDATMLEKTVARAIIKSYEKGSLYSLETLLSRLYGKPRESIEATVEQKVITVTLNLDDNKRG